MVTASWFVLTGYSINYPSLKKYCEDNGMPVDSSYFKKALIVMGKAFADRFVQFRDCKETLRFIIDPIKTCAKNLKLNPFKVDVGK